MVFQLPISSLIDRRLSRAELAYHLHRPGAIDHVDLGFSTQHLAGVADIDGCLDLVSRQHPDLDPSVTHKRDRLSYLVLQFILDRRGAC